MEFCNFSPTISVYGIPSENLSLKIFLAQNNRKSMILEYPNIHVSVCRSTISRITLNKKINVYIFKNKLVINRCSLTLYQSILSIKCMTLEQQ